MVQPAFSRHYGANKHGRLHEHPNDSTLAFTVLVKATTMTRNDAIIAIHSIVAKDRPLVYTDLQ